MSVLLGFLTAPAIVLYRDLSRPIAVASLPEADAVQDALLPLEQLLSLRCDSQTDQ